MARLLERSPFSRVVAIGAHPDDLEIGAGGLLARLARSGARVVMAVMSVPSQAEERIAEARQGASLIGAELLLVNGHDPVRLGEVPMHTAVSRLDEIIEHEHPDLVLTHSDRDLHWDHRLVHDAARSALRRNPCDCLAFVSTPELHSSANFLNTCFVDITETLEIKLSAISAHATQIARHSADPEACRELARFIGRLAGCRYAESFEVLRLRL